MQEIRERHDVLEDLVARGAIAASECGKVFRFRGGLWSELRPYRSSSGYASVKLRCDGRRRTYQVSQIVYRCFNGPIPPQHDIDHLNHCRSDNRLENLRLEKVRDNRGRRYGA